MRIHRLIAILMMIEKKGTLKAQYLAEALEVSTRTIYRDIDALTEAGFPLYATTGPRGGLRFAENYSLGLSDDTDRLPLTDLMKNLPSIPESASTALAIESAFSRLKDKTTGAHPQPRLSNRILIDRESWWGEHDDPFEIRTIIDALWHSNTLSIQYSKGKKSSRRIVNPYGLVLKHSTWYLIAYCQTAQALRTFRCDKILMAEPTSDTYRIPLNFDLRAHWRVSMSHFKDSLKSTGEYLISLSIPAANLEQFDEPSMCLYGQKEGNYQAVITAQNYDEAKSLVVKYAGLAMVVKPAELRNFAVEVLRKQVSLYIGP